MAYILAQGYIQAPKLIQGTQRGHIRPHTSSFSGQKNFGNFWAGPGQKVHRPQKCHFGPQWARVLDGLNVTKLSKNLKELSQGYPYLAYILKGLAYLVREPIPHDSNMTVTFGVICDYQKKNISTTVGLYKMLLPETQPPRTPLATTMRAKCIP